jgi:monoamine oxidase
MSFDLLTNPWKFIFGNMAKEGSEPKPLGSYPESGINVLIVGTGLAGLTAAIECTRKGHKVQVLERDSAINTAGLFCHSIDRYDLPADMIHR